MPRADLVTVGETFEDLIFAALPRLPRAGEELRTSTFVRTVGGGAPITAIAARRLGASSIVVSALGPEAAARLRAERVGAVNLGRANQPHAITAALSTVSDRAFVTFDGVNAQLEPRLLVAVGRIRARHVHFAFFPRRCGRWTRVVAALQRRGATTSWDFGWNETLAGDRDFPRLAARVDFMFLNELEARLYDVARWRARPRHVVIKMGARGSRVAVDGAIVRAAARRVRAVDTTGAGDAFDGGFLFAILAGCSLGDALAIGNFVGAMSTRALGGVDALPRRRDLPARLRRP